MAVLNGLGILHFHMHVFWVYRYLFHFTSDNNVLMHPSMIDSPVILEAPESDEWLVEKREATVHLLRLFPDEKMRTQPLDGDTATGDISIQPL